MQLADRESAVKAIGVTLAFAALIVGSLVYVLDRPPDSTAFFGSLGHSFPGFFGSIGQSLPSFAHAFSFSVLTVLLLGGGKRAGALACLGWFAVECVFEAGQHSSLADGLFGRLPEWIQALPFTDRFANYFLMGTFDIGDLLAAAFGAVAAFVTTVCMDMRK